MHKEGVNKLKNHVSLRVYRNKDYVVNVVSDENLASHIEYNSTFRFGCILYIDGVRKTNGCLKESCLKEYDDYASSLLKTLDINTTKETIPFQ